MFANGTASKRGSTAALSALLACALVFGSGCSSAAPDTPAPGLNAYEQYVDDQLDALCEYAECWWLDFRTGFYGSAAEGATASHYINIESGDGHLFVAVCDQDCADIDLFLYDPAGVLVDSDSSVQAYPEFPTANAEIYFDAAASGTYRLDVKIYGCRASTCYYGVDVGIW